MTLLSRDFIRVWGVFYFGAISFIYINLHFSPMKYDWTIIGQERKKLTGWTENET